METQDWTAGYVAEIGYTYGYYQELNPLRMQMALRNAGFVAPEVGTACELGFGQGLSINLHAAASPVEWWGTDFNPAQAGFARELAQAAGNRARLFDEAFADFCARPDLPEFDFIAMHGIWSWVSDANRRVVTDFLRRKLKVGGVLYVSYNTQPGWAAMVPMRELLARHAEQMSAPGQGIVARVDSAVNFADQLLAANPIFTKENPQVATRLQKLKEQPRSYLAHEYFNRDWQPMSFATMAEWLGPAKLQYACSAHFPEHIDAINLSQAQRDLLAGIPDETFRNTVRDFCVNQQFRRDFWIKGARRMAAPEQVDALRRQRLQLVAPRAEVPMTLRTAQGEVKMTEAIYAPVLDLLADHQPRTLGQMEKRLKERNITLPQLSQAALVLCGTAMVVPVQDEEVVARRRDTAHALNRHLLQRARASGESAFLASPASGGGLLVHRHQHLFLQAEADGLRRPDEWAEAAFGVLGGRGADAAKVRADLQERAVAFEQKHRPALRALEVM